MNITFALSRIVEEAMGQIAESEKEVEWAAREVEHIIRLDLRNFSSFCETHPAKGLTLDTAYQYRKSEVIS